jgi:Co/Zn/Cd efflux system component
MKSQSTTLSKIWIMVIDLVIMALSWYWFDWRMTVLVLLIRYAHNIASLISVKEISAKTSSDIVDGE